MQCRFKGYAYYEALSKKQCRNSQQKAVFPGLDEKYRAGLLHLQASFEHAEKPPSESCCKCSCAHKMKFKALATGMFLLNPRLRRLAPYRASVIFVLCSIMRFPPGLSRAAAQYGVLMQAAWVGDELEVKCTGMAGAAFYHAKPSQNPRSHEPQTHINLSTACHAREPCLATPQAMTSPSSSVIRMQQLDNYEEKL